MGGNRDESVDILVIGSGAGGLLAATVAASLGASVVVAEKSGEVGGTSATSGGGIWIPNSPLAPAEHADSPDDAFRYIRGLASGNVPDANIHSFIRWAPRMVDWINRNTPVRYVSLPYIDYHAERDGGKMGYRTHLPLPMDGRQLGSDILKLRATSPAASLFGVINWDIAETFALLFRPKGWFTTAIRMVTRYATDLPHRLRSGKDRRLTLGTALTGGLWLAARDKGVRIWLSSELVELVREDGRVTGAVLRRNGKLVRVTASKGVIIASGGFERDADLRQLWHPRIADPNLSGSQVNNTGSPILAANAIGADLMNLDHAWWAPVFCVPGEDRGRLCTIERALPGSILVNQSGRRYLNEAASYHIVGRQMQAANDGNKPGSGPAAPSWLVFDATFRKKYPIGPILPMIPDLALPGATRSILKKASTIEGLAQTVGVPADVLHQTITRFNDGARKGVDEDFGRGDNPYDRMFGDMRSTPNPCLAPIEKGPFYAVPLYAGDIGTSGGIRTDDFARALTSDGTPIAGLYAIGNCSASVMGGSYPGAGSTLAPAMTFAYLAARHLMNPQSTEEASRPADADSVTASPVA